MEQTNGMDLNDAYQALWTIKKICKNSECYNCVFGEKGNICTLDLDPKEGCIPDHWDLSEAQAELENRNKKSKKEEANTEAQDPKSNDVIHHPNHYNFRGMECKDFIEKFVSDPKSYYEGNIFKYLYRYQEKNKEEDLNKAMEYTRLLKEYLYGKKD